MKVSEIGEFGLIELLAKAVAQAGLATSPALAIGIGDDAAAWRPDGSLELATTDILVEGIDFITDIVTWEELGWKALAVNLSDIAAMGGIPQYCLVTIGLPADTEVESVARLYQGTIDIARRFGTSIIGGDVTLAPLIMLSLTVIGKGTEQGVLTRSAARPGDLVAVTGYLGSSAAGLRALTSSLALDYETTLFLRQAHFRPQPRIAEGQMLVKNDVKAAIDISDGLIADLTHICQASRVGARVWADKLPIHPLVRAAFQDEAVGLALGGGEDFELLFTAPAEVMEKVRALLSTPVTVLGEIIAEKPGEVTVLDAQGQTLNLEEKGWDHFRTKR